MPRQREPADVDEDLVVDEVDERRSAPQDQPGLVAPDPVRALRRLRRLPRRRSTLDREQLLLVQLLRSQRISWVVLAGALEVTPQGVAQRYGRHCPGPG